MPVRADAEGHLPGRRAARRPAPSQIGLAVAVARHARERLTVNATRRAVRRQARVERDGEPVQVVGACGSGHGLLRWRGIGGLAGNAGADGGARIGRGAWASLSPSIARTDGLPSARDGRAALLPARAGAPAPGRRRADVADAAPGPVRLARLACSSPPGAGTASSRSSGPAALPGTGDVRIVDPTGRGPRADASRSSRGLAVRVAARSAVLDGELVVVDARGRADDEALRDAAQRQRRAGRSPARVRPPPPRRQVAAPARRSRSVAPRCGGPPAGRRGRGGARDRRRGAGAPRRGVGAGDRRRPRAAADIALPARRAQQAVAVDRGERAGRGAARHRRPETAEAGIDGGGHGPGARPVPAAAVRRGSGARGLAARCLPAQRADEQADRRRLAVEQHAGPVDTDREHRHQRHGRDQSSPIESTSSHGSTRPIDSRAIITNGLHSGTYEANRMNATCRRTGRGPRGSSP